ncbi:MAG: molybdenum cofactor guanylyltransferase [Acidobacteriota bacterium]|nr:molybdenum cofactor guanylyltransferase [Acidobacteriota bacterium]
MSRAGFVLVGGKSSRMGQNKAFLRIGESSLLDRATSAVRAAAGNVSLLGDPEIYGHLGFAVIPDEIADAGPLAGICSALRTGADWNLVAACDMPTLSVELLRALFEEAEANDPNCVIPQSSSGRLEPLCAVYHKRCLAPIHEALERGVRKVTQALEGLRIQRAAAFENPAFENPAFENLNTPQDWNRFVNG